MSDDYEYYQEETFLDEFAAFDRANSRGAKIDNLTATESEKFVAKIEATFNELSQGWSNIIDNPSALGFIVDRVDKLNNMSYVNPTALILGYTSVSNGQISDRKFQQISNNILPHVQESYTRKPDVIRYARWWILNGFS